MPRRLGDAEDEVLPVVRDDADGVAQVHVVDEERDAAHLELGVGLLARPQLFFEGRVVDLHGQPVVGLSGPDGRAVLLGFHARQLSKTPGKYLEEVLTGRFARGLTSSATCPHAVACAASQARC